MVTHRQEARFPTEAEDYRTLSKWFPTTPSNAFAPGGPTFINTGLIAAVDNEAQLGGVMAHEISHVALRPRHQPSLKANLIQLPAMLAGTMAGKSLAGQLAQLGIGFGANSVLLKYSRNAERDADLLGTRILNGAGYNPVEMARFFEKLNAEAGSARTMQFFSSHPNPGNRVKAVEDLIQYLPARQYNEGSTSELARMKQIVAKLPKPREKK
jgi:predicted Zn-dependent protease